MKSSIIDEKHLYIKGADIRLREICDERIYELYGDNVPEKIIERIRWELDAIKQTEMAYTFLFIKEMFEKNNITGYDITLKGTCSGSYVLYLCGMNNFNPMDYDISPYFAFGIDKGHRVVIDINVPTDMYECIVDSYNKLEGVDVNIKPHNDVQLAYNLSRQLNVGSGAIKLDDPDIINLFQSQDTVGLTEYKSMVVLNMLNKIKISSFDDMVKMLGLLHGTDTWYGNAEVLISEGTFSLKDVIATREDVFEYLVSKGVDEKDSFHIVEQVRKGKGISGDEKQMLKNNGVPDWYINCSMGLDTDVIRDHVWLNMWFKHNYKKEFYERLGSYYPDVIINLCTEGSHKKEANLTVDKKDIDEEYIRMCVGKDFTLPPELRKGKLTLRRIVSNSIKDYILSAEKEVLLFEGNHPSSVGWDFNKISKRENNAKY